MSPVAGYQAGADYDEFVDGSGEVRPAWRELGRRRGERRATP